MAKWGLKKMGAARRIGKMGGEDKRRKIKQGAEAILSTELARDRKPIAKLRERKRAEKNEEEDKKFCHFIM